MIVDSNGLIASKAWDGSIDGGDSLAETGRLGFLKYLIVNYTQYDLPSNVSELPDFGLSYNKLHNSQWEWIRNPTKWNDPKDVSRDQLQPMVCALSIRALYDLVDLEYSKLIERFFLYPNKDLSSPMTIGQHFRHKQIWWRLPYFWFSDLFLVLESIILCFFTPITTCQNDLNHQISLLHAEALRPTFISILAARLYLSKRDYKQALENYYTVECGNRDLIEYYIKAIWWLRARVSK